MTTERVAPAINPWHVAQQQFDIAADRLNLEPGLRRASRLVRQKTSPWVAIPACLGQILCPRIT